MMATLWQDMRYGLRMLARSPGFTAVVVVVLGLGVGATTALLSVVDAVLFRSCPYKDPQRLVCLYETKNPERAERSPTSLAGFSDWRRQQHVFERLEGASQWNGIVRVADQSEQARGFLASEGLFSLLGTQPILGRTFLPEEYTAGGAPVVVLNYDHWRHWLGGDPNVIGKTVLLSDRPYTVVGVLSRDFRWVFQGVACGLWMPLSLDGVGEGGRDIRGLQALGRLKAGVSVEQAQAEMDLIAARLAQSDPQANANRGIRVVPINEDYAQKAAGFGQPETLLVLLGVVAAVLLIACVHVANLLVARSAVREQEIAIRAALGAHRRRLMRQLLTESVLLAAGGGLLGLLLAHLGIEVLSALRSRSIPWYIGAGGAGAIPWFVQVHIDARVLLYVLGLSLLTCVLCGTLPALGAARISVSQRLSAGRTRTTGAHFQKLRAVLVMTDVAMAFVLLAGAGLLINSYLRVVQTDRHFNSRHVLAACIAFDWRQGPGPAQRLAAFEEALRRTRELPGVQAVTASSYSPVSGSYTDPSFQMEGHVSSGDGVAIPLTDVFPGYFRLLQIPLLQGRFFTEQDNQTTVRVAIVNEAMARRFWPNENVIGKHITRAGRADSEPVRYEIVGVVGNVWHSHYPLHEPEVYVSYLQGGYPAEIYLMMRTSSDPAGLTGAARRTLSAAASGAVVDHVMPLEEEIAALFSAERLNMLFLSVFAAAALLLASLGVYGTTAYTVSWRTHEIGIRMALGARSTDVLGAVLGQGLRLALGVVVIGLLGALLLTRVLAGLLHAVSPTDPLTFACVALLLTAVALLASYLPSRRAARVDPMSALRYE